MAGFFGFFDYTKPGPGIKKNAPKKNRFIVFFSIYFRKFWKLVTLNLLYIACCLPIVTIGPATAGFTYILRNFAREEHAFIWLDFKDTIKKNWKQSLIIGIINVFTGILFYFAIPFYYQFYNHTKNSMYIIPFALCILALVIFVFMQYYLYTMLITFNLKIGQLYKNAFIFSFVAIGRNLLITLFLILIGLVTVFYFPLSMIILLPTVSLSTGGLVINFIIWPVICKYMIDPYYEGRDDRPDRHDDSKDQIFEDEL